MAKISIKVEGLQESEHALEDLLNTVGVSRATGKNVLRRALIHAGEPMVRVAKSSAPVRKGRLRVSIAASTKLSKRQKSQHTALSPVEVFIGAGPLPQAHLQEFGTSKQRPQPFLRPAMDQNIHNIAERFSIQLKIEIDKAAERARAKLARLITT